MAGVVTVDAAAESAAVAVVVPVAFAFDDAVAVSDTCRVYKYIYIHGISTHLFFCFNFFSNLDFFNWRCRICLPFKY